MMRRAIKWMKIADDLYGSHVNVLWRLQLHGAWRESCSNVGQLPFFPSIHFDTRSPPFLFRSAECNSLRGQSNSFRLTQSHWQTPADPETIGRSVIEHLPAWRGVARCGAGVSNPSQGLLSLNFLTKVNFSPWNPDFRLNFGSVSHRRRACIVHLEQRNRLLPRTIFSRISSIVFRSITSVPMKWDDSLLW